MNLFRKKDATGSKPPVKPPEPEFFDSPDKEKTGPSITGLLRNRTAGLALAGAALVLFSVFFVLPGAGKKKKEPGPARDEKRVHVTAAAMERAIDVSANANPAKARVQAKADREKKKRKYDSTIAVFVEAPRDERKAEPVREDSRDPGLGISSGTKIPALLSSRVFSFNVEAPVTAVLAKDFKVRDRVVIPKGAQFLGEVAVLKSANRINIRFDLLIFPDGRELRVRALALAEDGSAGIRGKVDKHTDRKVLKAVGETLLAGTSLFAGGVQSEAFSLEDQMRLNLAQNLTNEAARDLRSTRIEKSVTVEAYTPVQVILLEAV